MPELSLARSVAPLLALLAALQAVELLVLPLLLFFGQEALGLLLPLLVGACARSLRLALHQRVRRTLRQSFMIRAARDSLRRAAPVTAGADAAFWGAHILEYALCVDAPAVAGALLGATVVVVLASTRVGTASVAIVLAVLALATLAGLLASRSRRRAIDTIVERRHEMAVWMAAALEDEGEIRSERAVSAFLAQVHDRAVAWSSAEDRVERQQALHRALIVAATLGGLLCAARALGLVFSFSGATTLDSLASVLLLGALLPASWALHVHLESLAVAHAELARLRPSHEPRIARGCVVLSQAPAELSFSDIVVEYAGAKALAIDQLTLDLKRPLVITGPNGAGKTTMAKLVVGLLVPERGRVAMDGVATAEVDPDAMAFVPQDPVLLESLSVLENLRLVAPECSREDALATLEALGMPDPSNALDGAAGSFSRGEARRLATARALLTPARVLVLDEPDAWLDSASRARLVRALLERSRHSALVLVSHRLDVIAHFDQIVSLSAAHGVEAVGNRREVLARSAAFRALTDGESEAAPA